nr:hypothetical protein [Anaerolineae bacterium]
MSEQTALSALFTLECQQRVEEGCDPAAVEAIADEVDLDAPPEVLQRAYDRLMALQPAGDFPYHEPSDLAGIRAARAFVTS